MEGQHSTLRRPRPQRPKDEPEDALNILTGKVIGAAIEVHRELGPGFTESVYEEALCRELELQGIPFTRQARFEVFFKGEKVGEGRVDIMVGGLLIVELKAVEALALAHSAQLLSYLKMSGLSVGLLINFNCTVLKNGIKRIFNHKGG
jgi:GxxExxY protein